MPGYRHHDLFFAELGTEFQPGFDLEAAIRNAVTLATMEIPLRPNAVDPLTRKKTVGTIQEQESRIFTGNLCPESN